MAQTTSNSLAYTVLSLRNIIEWVKQIGHPRTGGSQTLFDAIETKTIPSAQFNQLAKQGDSSIATNTTILTTLLSGGGAVTPAQLESGLNGLKTALQGSDASVTLEAIKNEILNIDLSSVAQRTDVKDGNDTVISVSKTVKDKIGTNATGQADTLFAAIKQIDKAQVEEGVTNIQQRLGVTGSYDASIYPVSDCSIMAQNHAKIIYGEVLDSSVADRYKATAVVRIKMNATDNDTSLELSMLRRNFVFGGTRRNKSISDGSVLYTIELPDTGYGFTELWLKEYRDSSVVYDHYKKNPAVGSEDLDIDTLHPALEDLSGQTPIYQTVILRDPSLINENEE